MKGFIILVAAAIVADSIHAQEPTEGNTKIYHHGNSTVIITQDGRLSEITVERDSDSQTIIQRSGGNSAVIIKSTGKHTAPPETDIELQTSEEFRWLLLDRLDQRYFE